MAAKKRQRKATVTARVPAARLVADIGGTNARFALFERGRISGVQVLACAAYPDLAGAIEHYLASAGCQRARRPREAAIAIACPLTGDRVAMTNHVWSFSAAATRRALKLRRLLLLNDFTALALAVPHLGRDTLQQIGGGNAVADAAIAVLGPGTGLGVSGLVPVAGHFVPLQGEGGHVTLPATTHREVAILQRLQQRFAHVSAERLLSGPGLALLYETICDLDGVRREGLEVSQITERGLRESAGACRNALEQFCAWLGTVAGDLVLTLGAGGGVYIGGGIVPRFGAFFEQSAFRARFEAKGRFSAYLASVPAFVITARNPALLGCARAFADPGPRLEAA
jgi:glucokinase